MSSYILGTERIPGSVIVSERAGVITINEDYEFLVETDNAATTRQQIIFGTTGLPLVGVMYSGIGLVCRHIDAERMDDDPFHWKVKCKFESGRENQRINTDPEFPGNPNNPTSWIPVFAIDGFETKQKILTKDKTGKLVVNAANQRFETPLVENVQLPTFSFVQFEPSSLTLSDIMARNETMNSTSITADIVGTFPEKTLKMNITSAVLGVYGPETCWRIGYKCCHDPDTWVTPMLNVGTVFLGDLGEPEPYMDEKNLIRIVGNLEADGTKRSMSSDPLEIDFENLTAMDFKSFVRGIS